MSIRSFLVKITFLDKTLITLGDFDVFIELSVGIVSALGSLLLVCIKVCN